jgi:hypothetical protein
MALAFAAACDDSTGVDIELFLITDTVEVAAPLPGNEALPTAVDITFDAAGGISGGRFPERSRDALAWDFVVRIRDGELMLVPAATVGVQGSRAGITRALEETFEGVREAPPQTAFLVDTVTVNGSEVPVVGAVAMRVGSVYAVRSREVPTGLGFSVCSYFGKLQPLDVDVAAGILRFQIVANQCGDPRLVEPE